MVPQSDAAESTAHGSMGTLYADGQNIKDFLDFNPIVCGHTKQNANIFSDLQLSADGGFLINHE